jgi:hypothetical protein
MPLSGRSYGGRRGLKSPDPGPFKRRPPKSNLTKGFAHPKPTRAERKPPKRLQSKGSIQRKTWMPKRREKPRRGPWRSKSYRARVRGLPCSARSLSPCWWPPAVRPGTLEASHTGEDKGAGMKAGDQSCVSKCSGHHKNWEGRSGPFLGWTRRERQDWAAERVAETQAALGWTPALTEAA